MKAKINVVRILLTLSGTMLILFACTKNNLEDSNYTADCSTAKSWTSDVSPLIQSYCTTSGCHAAGSSNGPGALTTYQQVYTNRSAIRTKKRCCLLDR
jgi:hypothetical protein